MIHANKLTQKLNKILEYPIEKLEGAQKHKYLKYIARILAGFYVVVIITFLMVGGILGIVFLWKFVKQVVLSLFKHMGISIEALIVILSLTIVFYFLGTMLIGGNYVKSQPKQPAKNKDKEKKGE